MCKIQKTGGTLLNAFEKYNRIILICAAMSNSSVVVKIMIIVIFTGSTVDKTDIFRLLKIAIQWFGTLDW